MCKRREMRATLQPELEVKRGYVSYVMARDTVMHVFFKFLGL